MEIKHRSELYTLLKHLGLHDAPVCEVGVAEGNFSRDMLAWGISRLYMVDNWAHIPNQKGDGGHSTSWHKSNYESAMDKVAPYADRAFPLKGMSIEMCTLIPDGSLGMVYIDAAHDYESVLADLKAYYPKVMPGGVIAGHDYLNPAYGVKDAVMKFCRDVRVNPVTIPENNPHDASFYFIKP